MPTRISSTLCAQCKGSRRLCGRLKCPIIERMKIQLKLKDKLNKNYIYGSTPPDLIVGEIGYPEVLVGPMIPPITGSKAILYGNPTNWYGKSIEEIIRIRSSIVRANFRVKVGEASRISDRLLGLTQEIAMSYEPIDTEAYFRKPPIPRLIFDGVLSPVGPSARLRKLIIAENPIVPRKAEQLIYDYDARASEAISELYDYGYSNYYLIRLLTAGLLGRKRERRIVPTRWGITAIDSIIGDHLLEKIRDYMEISEIIIFTNEYLDNRYIIILMPGSYAFEMIEIWLPKTIWVRRLKPYIIENFELYDGKWRSGEINGGYKAMRLAVLEYLNKIRRQAMVLAIREIGPEYYCPVGVWQVREGMRNAFKNKPIKVDSIDNAIKIVSSKLRTEFQLWIKYAKLIQLFKFQRKIVDFIRKSR